MKIAKQKPLSEVTLRRYESPYEKLKKRELIRFVALSLGLIQPGDSRDIIVDILCVLIKNKKGLTFTQVEKKVVELREKNKSSMLGITPGNIHRQLRRLKEIYIIEKHMNLYRLSEGMSLKEIFEKKVENIIIKQTIERIKEYLNLI